MPIWPREGELRTFTSVAGVGYVDLTAHGWLYGMIVDVQGNATYKLAISGPTGVEYYISPTDVTGDTTIMLPDEIPLTGKMRYELRDLSIDGVCTVRPIGAFVE
jgi:hypothetical protein